MPCLLKLNTGAMQNPYKVYSLKPQGVLVLSQAVVGEFSPSTASPLGLPWEQHDRCRKSLQQDYLQTFYQHAYSMAGDTARSASQEGDGGVCCACLSLMAAELTWDFRSSLVVTLDLFAI